MRPHSIVQFERLYLGAWALGVVNTAIGWSHYRDMPQVRAAQAQFGAWYLPVTVGFGLLIPLILWYFTARRGSAVAKWIVVVLTALGVIGVLAGLLLGSYVSTAAMIFGIVTTALNLAATTMLFRADAKPWFGEVPADVPEA